MPTDEKLKGAIEKQVDPKNAVHPYIPNSVPEIRKEMLKEIGVKSVEEIYVTIPKRLRLSRPLKLPKPLLAECDLRRNMERILSKNKTCKEYLNFLGAGCWQHHVPAVCDEINQ
jgi:glycine dehydrogenase subunit 1